MPSSALPFRPPWHAFALGALWHAAAAEGEDALHSFLEDQRQDDLLLTFVVAMAARRHADAVEFSASPLISLGNGVLVVRLLEIKMYPSGAVLLALALPRPVCCFCSPIPAK
jgi:hypothetical protein